MKRVSSSALARKQRRELKRLAELPDEDIDTGDIAEVVDWSGAKRGLFYRPVKKQLTLRLDADILAWFRNKAERGRGYQTAINEALRDHIKRYSRHRKAG